jgi:Glyoxalase/Bleomycin resistance protein/Dioxygenase superfamily
MAITGVHALMYTPEADALRSVLGDVIGWPSVDAGDGWRIFALPPAELGIHPADEARHELTFMCDDITATMAALAAKGVEFTGEPANQGWGIATTMILPGGVHVMLYEPRHPLAHEAP